MVSIQPDTAQKIIDAIEDYESSPVKTRRGDIRRAFNCEVDSSRYHLVMRTDYDGVSDEHRVLVRLRADLWRIVDGVRYHDNQFDVIGAAYSGDAVDYLRRWANPADHSAQEGYGEW